MSNRIKTLLALTMLLGGCRNWSDDVGRYRQVLDTAQPSTRPAYAEAQALRLTEALALANADNEAIASRGEDYVQALAEKMRQAGTFLPTLSFAPSYALNDAASGTAHQSSAALRASASGSLAQLSDQHAAAISVERRAQLLLDERETVLLQTMQSFYAVLKSERQARVYENGVTLKSERVRDQEARLKLGNVRPLDVAQSQADLAGTRAALTQSSTDAANARSALARLIGVTAVRGELIDDIAAPEDVGDLRSWHADASAGRQDLQASARAVDIARTQLEAAIRQYFPSVTIDYTHFLHTDPSSATEWTSGISANVPIFSAWQIEADVRRAWSAYRQAGLAESQTRRQVQDDVTQAFQSLQGSRLRLADLQVQLDAARRAFDLAERAYQLGSISNLDRLTQQDNLLTAELNFVSEQLDEKARYLSLLRATGSLSKALAPP